MNYQITYEKLILSAALFPKQDSYKERHHIVPKCMGGTDDKTNLVQLTARQHFLAHWLLYKIYKTTKLAHAWYSMCRIGDNQDARKQSSHLFEYARKRKSEHMSKDFAGENNWFYGKTHTKESIQKLLSTRNATYAKDPERLVEAKKAQGAGASRRWKGVPKSPESNKKRGRKNLMMLKNKFTGDCVRVLIQDRQNYDPDIWVSPYSIREKKYGACPHCTKYGELNSTFNRWHFDNCRGKNNENQINKENRQ